MDGFLNKPTREHDTLDYAIYGSDLRIAIVASNEQGLERKI